MEPTVTMSLLEYEALQNYKRSMQAIENGSIAHYKASRIGNGIYFYKISNAEDQIQEISIELRSEIGKLEMKNDSLEKIIFRLNKEAEDAKSLIYSNRYSVPKSFWQKLFS